MKKQDSILLVAGGVIALSIAAYMLARNKQPNSNMNTTLPRGYRNNNPLNIRYSRNNTWIGKVTPNTDGAFEQLLSYFGEKQEKAWLTATVPHYT